MRILNNILRRFFRPVYIVLRNTIQGYNRNRDHRMGASIAYYTIFSLPAILIIVIAMVGSFLGEAAVEGKIYGALFDFIGEESALQIQNAVKNIGSSTTNWWMTVLGVGFLIFIATNIFYAIQETLNKIFEVEETPRKLKLLEIIINRILSFGMIIIMGLLLIASVLLNGFLLVLSTYVQNNKVWLLKKFPAEWSDFIISLSDNFLVFVNLSFSITLVTIFFVMLYKILPAIRLRWRYILQGSIFAAILFWAGQLVIGYYLKVAGVINAYGAAGALIALLIWVYYSAQLIFIGAEFIKALCNFRGVNLEAKNYAKLLQKHKKHWIKKKRVKDSFGNIYDDYDFVQ
jgi:membrane protein